MKNDDIKINQKAFKAAQNTLFETDLPLDSKTIDNLKKTCDDLEKLIFENQKQLLKIGRLLDYNSLKKQGRDGATLKKIAKDDDEYLSKVEEFYLDNHTKRDFMFGYPANLEEDSYMLSYLRFLESKLYLMNNCGDPYQRGNYGMDSKETEKEILQIFASSFGLKSGEYWGYVTSGGTESNYWAIREAFSRFPDGILYFCENAHYSVEKYVYNNKAGKIYPYKKIKEEQDGSICFDDLIEKIEANRQKSGYKPVILVLTWGTTKEGAIDNVKKITDYLINCGIEFYCHLDAALFGGIPKRLKNAPGIYDIKGLNVDSVSVSLHKFLGAPVANGILISLKHEKRKQIDYIGQEDSTLLGSRGFPPFSTLQRIKEFFYLKDENYYIDNIRYFEQKLIKAGIEYQLYGGGKSNIFVIKKPSDKVLKKYQLTAFLTADGELAHIIIFPFHKKQQMDALIQDLIIDFGL